MRESGHESAVALHRREEVFYVAALTRSEMPLGNATSPCVISRLGIGKGILVAPLQFYRE